VSEIKSKEELYALADENKMLVCGDENCMEDGVDYSHIEYLIATGKIRDKFEILEDFWPVLWPTLQKLLDNLVQSGENNTEVNQELQEWKDAYSEQSTEVRIFKKYLSHNISVKKKFLNFRKKQLEILEKSMKLVLKNEEERRQNELLNQENKESTTEATGTTEASSDTN